MGSVPESPFMPQRQGTQPVDMIGDLPDIDFFSIPGARPLALFFSCKTVAVCCMFCEAYCVFTVDDFYEDYVTELGTRNSRRLSGKFEDEVSVAENPRSNRPAACNASAD